MAEKKLSVAEILAAARKADKGDAAGAPEAAAPETSAPAEKPAAPGKPAAAAPAAKKPAGGARLSVAEMMAAARAEKTGGAAAAPTAPAEKPAAKPAAAKAAPAKKEAPAAKSEPVDTQSILTAARKTTKPGPMTKAEAEAKAAPAAVAEAKKAKAKEAIVVPPMPVKPAYAKPGALKAAKDAAVAERRAFLFGMSALAVGFTALSAAAASFSLGVVRFMFPNILREPPSRFSVGTPDKFPAGQVEERFKAQFGVWIVNTEYNGQQQIVALKSVCTHLGCTPNWLEAEQKFKCPCHGSGFYKDGINFEGPAPRPLERYAIGIGSDGSIEVDKSRTFQEEMGAWNDPSCYIPV